MAEAGEPYPEIVYGAATPERLTTEKMEKKMKKVAKEGGKRGVEIEGAADMGGLQFFCTTMDEPNGDVDMLYESMKAMNAKSNPDEEERKGGSGRIGKMIISKDQEDSKLAMVAYCPPAKQAELTAEQWMKDIVAKLGGGDILFSDATTAKAEVKNDADKGLFVLKLKDSAITESINYLKGKGLFPDSNDDDDDDYVFGDDDFPSADVAEAGDEAPAAAEEAEVKEETADPAPAAEEGSEPYPEIAYGAATPERLTTEKMEKKMKKVTKEGGKRGVEIEGAADMGGLQFFCTTMDEPNGDVDMLYESMKAMNAKSNPDEEERKGGSGRIGKMIISKDQEDSKLAMVAYCPPAKQAELTAEQWMKDIVAKLGGGDILFSDATTAKAEVKNDADKGLFVLKLKDSAITESINYLKGKGLFPDSNDDDDDDYVFGDDDFPSADVAEAGDEAPAAADEAEVKEETEDPAPAAEEGGERYPEIAYGAATPERLTTEKMEKKMKKVAKEGGKRGVEIEGAADMGGLQFFCTTMDEPNGDVDMLYESMKAMNAKSNPDEEERKGGSGRIGKMIISKDQEDSKLAMVAYCPPAKQAELTAEQWMKDILAKLGGGEVLFGDATTAKAEIKNDTDKGLFVLKLKDSAITESINYLKGKGLFPDSNDDDDDDYVFGDDDFPSA